MNNLIKISVVSIVWFMACATYGQTYKDKDNKALEDIQSKTSLLNVVAAQNNQLVGVNNVTRVQQVGNYNSAFAVTNSNYSYIDVNQFGNRNDVNMVVAANKISEDVLQIGNNHSFTDLSISRSDIHAANVLQFGANQNLIWLGGQNSMSDKMMVTMKGKNQTVIIRNLKN